MMLVSLYHAIMHFDLYPYTDHCVAIDRTKDIGSYYVTKRCLYKPQARSRLYTNVL